MSMHKLTAGDGYLTRHIAAGNAGLDAGASLAAFYEQMCMLGSGLRRSLCGADTGPMGDDYLQERVRIAVWVLAQQEGTRLDRLREAWTSKGLAEALSPGNCAKIPALESPVSDLGEKLKGVLNEAPLSEEMVSEAAENLLALDRDLTRPLELDELRKQFAG
jgi:hypothetical protein